MDAGVVARLTGAKLVGSTSTANIGRGSNLAEAQIHVVVPDETLHFGRSACASSKAATPAQPRPPDR